MRECTMDAACREKYGLHAEWEGYRFECRPPGASNGNYEYVEIVGVVAPRKSRGPNKDRRDWKRADKSTERTCVLSFDEWHKWKQEWEQRTGKCSECEGAKKVCVYAHANGERRFATCRKCNGTGAMQAEVTGTTP